MMRSVLAILGLVACNGGDDPDTGPVPTYYADVRPLIDEHCARCHTSGGVAPVSFDDVATVVAMGNAIASETASGAMPPPAPDPTCRDYEGSASQILTDEEQAVLQRWVDGDMPLGEPADGPPPFTPPTVGPFDDQFVPSVAFAPTFADPQAPGNEYRCFAFDFDHETTQYATAFEALIDQTPIVHHVVLFRDHNKTADVGDADGFGCSGLGEDGWEILAAWGPGAAPVVLPQGAGVPIEPHDRLVVQMHYFESGVSAGPDATGYGLLLTDTVETPVAYLNFGVVNFSVPAGESDYAVHSSDRWPMGQGQPLLYGGWPHMHVAGRGMEVTITRNSDDLEQCALRMNDWNFHDQAVVPFLEPLQVNTGDKIEVTCRYDNSDGTSPIEFGEGTQNEMCFAFFYAGF